MQNIVDHISVIAGIVLSFNTAWLIIHRNGKRKAFNMGRKFQHDAWMRAVDKLPEDATDKERADIASDVVNGLE